jgi:hypothetical protein
MTVHDEPRRVAEARADEIAALSWEELDAYGDREETITACSGDTFRVKSRAYWDMDEWASGMNISVKVYPSKGVRRIWGYNARRTRGSADDPVPKRPTG